MAAMLGHQLVVVEAAGCWDPYLSHSALQLGPALQQRMWVVPVAVAGQGALSAAMAARSTCG